LSLPRCVAGSMRLVTILREVCLISVFLLLSIHK